MSEIFKKDKSCTSNKQKYLIKKTFFWFLLVLCLIAGLFLLVWLNIPYNQPLDQTQQNNFTNSIPISNVNKLIIPKISVNSQIFEGDISALKKGTWHRYTTYGNPEKGGNFILAAHRYIFSIDPRRVIKESVLYNIDKLAVGDEIFIHWNGRRYRYKIHEKFLVKPNATEIESQSNEAFLTLYSCTKKGSVDGREVIRARLVK